MGDAFVILISNVEVRKAFDLVNILRHHFGPHSCLLTTNKAPALLLTLSYKSRIYLLRDDSYINFERDLLNLLNLPGVRSKTIIYLPVEEQATLLFYQFTAFRPSLPQLKYLLPSVASFSLARHKLHLAKYCLANGFKVPPLLGPAELLVLQENFRPVIIKPVTGSGSRGIRRIDSPRLLRGAVLADNEFAQEMVDTGHDIEGAFFLFREGEFVNAFTHRRLRCAPRRGGVTVLSKCTCNQRLIETGAAILSGLKWNGLAMLEFVYDARRQEYLLLEINPRIWGSALLSEFCGANLIKQYVTLTLGRPVERSETRPGTYIRWIFPYDVMSLLKGQLRPSEFWFKPSDPVCYIGFTFSSWPRSLCFILASVFNLQNIKKFAVKSASRCL
jgi:hypothetical protein